MQQEPHGSSSLVQIFFGLVVGLAVGSAASWALLFGSEDKAVPWVDTALKVVLPVLGGIAASLAVGIPVVWWLLKRLLARGRGTLEQMAKEVGAAARAVSDGRPGQAATHAEQAALEAIAWYTPAAARRWIAQTAIALLITIGGLIGTALVFRQTTYLGKQTIKLEEQTELFEDQNEKVDEQTNLLRDQNAKLDEQIKLLREQNRKIDLQTITSEAQRRSGLGAELTAIIQSVSSLTRPPEAAGKPSDPLVLPPTLLARIIAFSGVAVPYRVVEVVDVSKSDFELEVSRLRSPERGQLLVSLAHSGVEIWRHGWVTYVSADLRGQSLNGFNLTNLNLSRADLERAVLHSAKLEYTNLFEAVLRSTLAHDADFRNATLHSVDATGASFEGANFTGASMASANLEGANLKGANLTSADLRYTNLQRADFAGADLTNAVVGAYPKEPSRHPGWLPEGFPKGWEAVPEGWVISRSGDDAVLRRH